MNQSNGRGDIHMFKYRGLQLVYDVNSGSLHQVDDLAWELLELRRDGDWPACGTAGREKARRFLRPGYTDAEVEAALRQIESLQDAGLLFSPEHCLQDDKLLSKGVKALCLFISHDCNLGCRYCFTHRTNKGKKVIHMGWEVGKKAVDFLLHSGPGHFREIDFFGGEPLLNFPLIRAIVNYARTKAPSYGKEFDFTLTTNGTLLDKQSIDFLKQEDLNVILSLDGRPAVHNRMRSFKNGRGSYEITVKNIQKLLQERNNDNYYIRGTYTRNNLDFTNDIKHFLALGFSSLSLEPVVSNNQNLCLREDDLPVLTQEYDRLVDLYLDYKEKGRPFLFYHFILDLEKGPCLYKRLSGCGAGMDYLAVAADGSLYPCHQFEGMDEFYMGNITDEPFTINREAGNKLAAAAREREACKNCWARYLCGRGCAAGAYFSGGGLHGVYRLGCALEKIRLERALYLQAL